MWRMEITPHAAGLSPLSPSLALPQAASGHRCPSPRGPTRQGHSWATEAGYSTKPLARGEMLACHLKPGALPQMRSWELLPCQPSTRKEGWALSSANEGDGWRIHLGSWSIWRPCLMVSWFLLQNMGNYLLSWGQGFSWNPDINKENPQYLLCSIMANLNKTWEM